MIIVTLKNLSIHIEDEKRKLSQLSTEQLVEAVVKCVNKIDPSKNLPIKLPSGMSARFNAGSRIAEACKSLGCSGDLGYQTFLYSNEQEIRSILIYLIEKLPKNEETQENEEDKEEEHDDFCNCSTCYPDDDIMLAVQLLPKETRNSAIEILNRKRKAREKAMKEGRLDELEEELAKIRENSAISKKINDKNDDFEEMAKNKAVSSMKNKFETKEKIVEKKPETKPEIQVNIVDEEEESRKREEREAEEAKIRKEKEAEEAKNMEQERKDNLKLELLERKAQLEEEAAKKSILYKELRAMLMSLVKQIKNLEKDQTDTEERIKIAEEELEKHRKILALIPEGEENIAKLQGIISRSKERLAGLKKQWADHRNPLDQEFQDLQDKYKVAKASDKTLSNLHDKIAEVEEGMKQKETQYKTLNEQASNLEEGQSREAFTKKILEIVGSITKQQDGIDKIIEDVKSVQKDINLLNGRLERAFFDTTRIMKQPKHTAPFGKKDKNVIKSIDLLSSIHEECYNTVEAVRKTGALKREIRELEDIVEMERQKDLASKTEKLKKDLELLQNENKEMTKKYRKLKGK